MIEQQVRMTDEIRRKILVGVSVLTNHLIPVAFTTALRHYATNPTATVEESIQAGLETVPQSERPAPAPVETAPVSPEPNFAFAGLLELLFTEPEGHWAIVNPAKKLYRLVESEAQAEVESDPGDLIVSVLPYTGCADPRRAVRTIKAWPVV